ncbi:putative hydrolase of the HAD superfamily [Roseovarius halotolerans]|uniref:Fructose-1-P/6-phosphogluconate phosphatase n=1 Tax=Roseovarius halotolerans TaxID=505353 RepID=A0A1X6YCL6_9RHOB|nr:pyrimidine 5'-nucleotidase [Roseovarius halotolerans]RKT34870.1 putative hydrolase of the HAD superfamily [Roseovarius halotolerans]SLN17428.1 fructose-1-P/6-phosphogluconate phosphatase [Roseovarius halotolerans]
MPKSSFTHVESWVFDLDNTLYPPHVPLFDQIRQRMTDFVMTALGLDRAAADRLRARYWREHGTTLAGLMREHDIDPDAYLVEVHDISFDDLTPDPELRSRIAALPGRRVVYTNGSAPYAEQVVARRGLSGVFDAVYGVEHAAYHPKPDRRAFEAIFARDGISPSRAAMFEDDPRNLVAPHEMGMRTVHVAPEPLEVAHIQHHTDDLSRFLSRLI